MVQPIRSPENPGTTVVSIGHLIPWPENPGYRTQVWDNDRVNMIKLNGIDAKQFHQISQKTMEAEEMQNYKNI